MPTSTKAPSISPERSISFVCASVIAVVYFVHAYRYFFLLDDYAIIGEAVERSVWTLVSTPLFGFFRPGEHLWIKLLYVFFSWKHPGGYLGCTLAIHCVSAWLVYRLCDLAVDDTTAALMASILFFLSPWGTEPVLWMSGGFDLFATAGLLGVVVVGLVIARTDSPNYTLLTLTGAGCCALGVASKEIGILAPVLLLVALVAVAGTRVLATSRIIAYIAAVATVTVWYLIERQHLLPHFASGYGTLEERFQRASVMYDFWSFARALVVLPLPSGYGETMAFAFVGAVALSGLAALRSKPRLVIACAVSMVLSVLPVLWVSLNSGSSAGNRFLYFAGVWFSLWLAVGAREWPQPAGRVLFLVMCLVSATSVTHQARVWTTASYLSAGAIDQVRPYVGTTQPIFIENLPSLFVDGPYIINTLAFRYYFAGRAPEVDAHLMTVKDDDGTTVFSFWMNDYNPPAESRHLRLSLPVWSPDVKPAVSIDGPHDQDSVSQSFWITGWALDANARQGTGVTAVRVFAVPTGDAAGEIYVGTAHYGIDRPDLVNRFGPNAMHGGFALAAHNLPIGHYRLFVSAQMTLTHRFVRMPGPEITILAK